jgi:DNA repair protein RadA
MLSGLKLSTVWETQKPHQYVPTGSERLDTILGGGIRTEALTEVFGGSGSGKTQFCIDLMLNTIFSPVSGNVIYVSTKNCLTPENINKKIGRYIDGFNENESESKNIPTVEDVLKRIKHKRVFKLNELIFIVYHIREIVERAYCYNPIKLVIIDSFTHFMRNQPPLQRLRISYELAGVLENTAVKFVC